LKSDKSNGRGDFFKIDFAAYRHAHKCGLNAAIAYLTCARGSDAYNANSRWSANSLESRTSLSRSQRKGAFADLVEARVLLKVREGRHPIYKLPSGSEITGNELEPEWVYLPNTLIDGAAGEIPPVELVRQAQNADALYLMLLLYSHHLPLDHDGGISRTLIQLQHERIRIGERGPFVIWGFQRGGTKIAGYELGKPFFTGKLSLRSDGRKSDNGWAERFWPALELITDTGIFERVGALFESAADSASIIHPYGDDVGEAVERQLAAVAHRTAEALLNEERVEYARQNRLMLAPVRAQG
jgi:hypothetical protein